jgi:diacylglycerol kinase
MPRPYSFLHRLGCAWHGVRAALRSERHLRVHLLAFGLVLAAGALLRIRAGEWAAVLTISALVIALELANAALERTLDLLHPQHHPLAGEAKDIMAGAVLVAAIAAIGTGILIFGPRLLLLTGLGPWPTF